MNLSNIISDEIKKIYPDIKPYLADRYANKYVSVVLPEIKQAILRPGNENEELSFNSKFVYNDCGITNTRERLFSFLQKSPKTRLIDITFRGNIGKLSRVKLNPIYKEQIMFELLEMPTQALTDRERKEIAQRTNKIIEIDTASLASFIEHTQQQTRITGPGKYYDALANNLLRARELYLEHQIHDGKTCLFEYWESADTGREYGHYNSLQRMNREVRHAALGVCHKYDFQAHSFAVMASIAKTIDPTIKIAQVEDYIRYRKNIRTRIAKEVGISEDAVKSVFTSLGFGARPINNPFNAIRRQVYTADAYERLINQTEFKFITEDLKTINATIDAYLPDQDFEWNLGLRYQYQNANGRRKTVNQKLAWIYQNTEAYLTKKFIQLIESMTGLTPLMTVHDCVYYRQKLPTSAVIDCQIILREEYEYIRIEHEDIWPIGTDQQFNQRFEQDNLEEQEHKNRVYQEELDACSYQSDIMAQVQDCNRYDSIAELRARIEKENQPDYTEYHYELPGFYNVR